MSYNDVLMFIRIQSILYFNLRIFFLLSLILLNASTLRAKPIYIGGGLGWGNGLPSSYILPTQLGLLGTGLNYNYVQQVVGNMNAKEQDVIKAYGGNPPPSANPPFDGMTGGCPDAQVLIPSTQSGEITVNSQLISVMGRGCAVTSGSGSTVLPIEGDFFMHWEFLDWMFLRTGLSVHYLPPVYTNVAVQFTGEISAQLSGIQLGPINSTINDVGAAVSANSRATNMITGWNFTIPIMIGMNIYHDKDRAFYFAIGPAFTTTSVTSKLSGKQDINLQVRQDDNCNPDQVGSVCSIPIRANYEDVTNSFTGLFQPGITSLLGFRHRVKDNLFFSVEFRNFFGGGIVNQKGSVRGEGKTYADSTVAGGLIGFFGGAGTLSPSNSNLGINLIEYSNRIYFGFGSFVDEENKGTAK